MNQLITAGADTALENIEGRTALELVSANDDAAIRPIFEQAEAAAEEEETDYTLAIVLIAVGLMITLVVFGGVYVRGHRPKKKPRKTNLLPSPDNIAMLEHDSYASVSPENPSMLSDSQDSWYGPTSVV